MADGLIQVPTDSTGKKVDTSELVVGVNTVERQRVVNADPTTAAALAAVENADPASTDYGLVVRDVRGNAALPVRVDPTGTTVQPVSAGSLPLPTGAATAAKQPALGTAGTASADVLTVQGIAAMTALKVDGSAVTQPVSAASLPLPTGAATAAKQSPGSSFNVGQVSVGSTDTTILAANANRLRIVIINTGTTPVYIGGTGVTATTGQYLAGIAGCPMSIKSTAAIHGITASGSQTVTYLEEVQ